MTVDAPGHDHAERSVDLVAGTISLAAIPLSAGPEKSRAVQLSDVNVGATDPVALTKFDDKAGSDTLTDSVSEAALKNSNAQSVRDFMKDMSEVAMSKGVNGSSTVSVRGIDQRMLRTTVDGQRQGGSGNPLDNIPPEIVQSLEVTKTFTPDMEADTVGGIINVNTGGIVIKDAYLQGRHQTHYNTTAPHSGTRNSFTVSQPFSFVCRSTQRQRAHYGQLRRSILAARTAIGLARMDAADLCRPTLRRPPSTRSAATLA